MLKDLKEDIFLFKLFALVVSIVGGIYILQLVWGILGYFSDVVLYLLLAWILSFVLEPLAERLMKLGVSRTLSTVFIYIVLAFFIIAFFILLLPVVVSQISTIIENLPGYLSSIIISQAVVSKVTDIVTALLSNSLTWISSVASFLFSLFVILFLSFYFLIERQKLLSFLGKFVPDRFKDELRFVSWAVSSSFATFIRVQLLFGVISGILTWFVLFILGINFALTAGVLSGIFTAIPVVGPVLALVSPVVLSLAHGSEVLIAVVATLVVLQFVEFNILGPKIWGKALRVHPVIIFISFIIGYKLAGGWGAVFAVPVVAILIIIGEPLVKHFLEKWSQ